jgi:hypothetical protein
LGNNCKQFVKRTYFSSQVSAWRIHGKVFRVEPIRDICGPTISGEIEASFVSEFFVSAANFADLSESSGTTVRSRAVHRPEADHDFLVGTPF